MVFKLILVFLFSFLAKKILSKSLTVFCYHDITDNPSKFSNIYHLNISPKIFEFQINFIKNNFTIISPDDLISGNIPKNAALITFDDGFKSYFTHAVPILKKYKIPSINFLNLEVAKGQKNLAVLSTYLCKYNKNFVRFLKNNITNINTTTPLHLYCSRKIIYEYIENHEDDLMNQIKNYEPHFANINDLETYSKDNLVYFGNHLYNHDVAILMKENEFINSFKENQKQLKDYKNSRNLFSFTHGIPKLAYKNNQINIIKSLGAIKSFSVNRLINFDINSQYLHRLALTKQENNKNNMWLIIFKSLFNSFYKKS